MNFGLENSAAPLPGLHYTSYIRYKDLVDEAVQAERMGFDFWGTTENHFGELVSAPEVFFGYIAAKTSRIRLRSLVTLLPFAFNHPIRVAEQVATFDILSDGRADLGIGRGNNIREIEGFGMPIDDTKAQMWEALEIIDKALSFEEFEHHGELMDVPLRRLTPKPVQTPHPPITVAAASIETCRIAGERGIGCMILDSYQGWEYTEEQIKAYRSGLTRADPVCGVVNDTLGLLSLSAYIDTTEDKAVEFGGDWVMNSHRASTARHPALGDRSADYAYLTQLRKREKYVGDLDFLRENTPTAMLGTSDDFIERIEKLEKMGIDEIIFQINGVGHEKTMQAFELIGRYVIPEFKRSGTVVRGNPEREVPLPQPAPR